MLETLSITDMCLFSGLSSWGLLYHSVYDFLRRIFWMVEGRSSCMRIFLI